uniref:Uncharacterized protein n=1 Tax=Arion vulgaris TaxID=1028688 RepID=A0A0B7AT15_9EUPU
MYHDYIESTHYYTSTFLAEVARYSVVHCNLFQLQSQFWNHFTTPAFTQTTSHKKWNV